MDDMHLCRGPPTQPLREVYFGGFSSRRGGGFLSDLHAMDTAPGGLQGAQLDAGEGTHSTIHRLQARLV